MIQEYGFGIFVIDGNRYGHDIKLIGNQVIPWKTRRGHKLNIDDIEDLVADQPKILVIGTGASGILRVGDEFKNFIRLKGIGLVIKKTKEACQEYNKLIKENKKVCAILHGTCWILLIYEEKF